MAINNAVPILIDSMLQKDNGYIQFVTEGKYESLNMDYEVTSSPMIMGNYMQIGVDGTVFNKGMPSGKLYETKVQMPYKNPHNPTKFQMFMSTAVLNSMTQAYF